jgi:hypothetical protein
MFCEVFVSRKENLLSMKNKLIGKVLALALSLMAAIALTAVTASAENWVKSIKTAANPIDFIAQNIVAPFDTVNNSINKALTPASTLTGTVSNLTGQASDITSAGSTVQGQLGDLLVNYPNTITGTVSNLQSQFNDAFVNAPNTVTGTVSNLTGQASDITGAGSTVQGQVADVLFNYPNTVSGTIDNLADSVNTATGAVSNVQGQVNDAFVNVPNTISGTVSNITGQASDIVGIPDTMASTASTVLGMPEQVIDTANAAYDGFINTINTPTAIFEASKVGNNILKYYLGEGAGAESVLSPFHNPIGKAEGVQKATEQYGPLAAPYGYIKGELTSDYRQAAAKELAAYEYSKGDASTANLELNEDTLKAYQTLVNSNQATDAGSLMAAATAAPKQA